MHFEIEITRKHAYVVSSLLVVLISVGLVNAFGGNNPIVLGHSAGELLVNGTSVVDNSLTGDDILESSLGTVPSATSASSASSASSVSCTDCLGSSQISESSFNWPVSSDLSCTDCIGGTEISESSLDTVPSATAAGSCDWSGDLCTDSKAVCSSCSETSCSGCGGFVDQVVTCSGGRITAIRSVDPGAC